MEAIRAASGFAARVSRFIESVEYKRVESSADLDPILQLRYEAYLKEGAVATSDEGRLLDRFDELNNVVNIGVYLEGKLISAIRLHLLEGLNCVSPALDVFPDILQPLLAKGKRIIDPNRFVADYASARAYPELPYATLRLSIMGAIAYDAQLATATVRAEHQAFYKRSYFATLACAPRMYPTLTKKISLMLMDFEHDQDRIIERSPYYASTAAERHNLFPAMNVSAPHYPEHKLPDHLRDGQLRMRASSLRSSPRFQLSDFVPLNLCWT